MNLLVTGVAGYTGGRLFALAGAAGWLVAGTYHRRVPDPADAGRQRYRLDVRDRDAVAALVRRLRPDAVVHTAYAQDDWVSTAAGAAHVALAAREVGARLVHVSSDAIFAGRPEPYTEVDVPAPVYPYGAAKAAAEVAVRAIDPAAAIVRTALIVGDSGSKHHRLAVDLATGRAGGALFTDEVRCPVSVDDLAAALLELAGGDFAGVLNVAGPQAVTRHELGRMIAVAHGLDPDRIPAGTGAAQGGARPGELRLDVTLASRVLATRLRPVREVLAA